MSQAIRLRLLAVLVCLWAFPLAAATLPKLALCLLKRPTIPGKPRLWVRRGGWWDKSRCGGTYISDNSEIDGECCKSKLLAAQREYRDHTVVDSDIDGDIFGDGEFCRDQWGWLHNRRG
jgi:hypothetical protein